VDVFSTRGTCSFVAVMLSVVLKQFQQTDVGKTVPFRAHADKNLRLVLSDNENEIEAPVRPCASRQVVPDGQS